MFPNDEAAIKTAPLGSVIQKYIEDKKIKLAAEKAVWLGNDEAHYVRKWESHDVSHLKSLLGIAINSISESLEFEKLMASFKKPI